MITNRNNFLTTHFLPNLHQRHRIHRSLTIKTPNLLSNEYHQSSQQKIQLDLHHESPLLIRSLRPINEEQISKNQLQLTPRTSTVHSKLDKKIFPHLKSHLLKHSNSHYQSRIEKSTSFSDLFISPRSIKNDFQIIEKTNMNKNPIDEWEDPKSNVAVSSDDDDSSMIKSNEFLSPNFIPNRHGYNFLLEPVIENLDDE